MNSSPRTIFQRRPASFLKALPILGLFIVVISYSYWNHLAGIKSVFSHLSPTTPAQTEQSETLADHGWPQKIWQTSQYPSGNISTENKKYMKTWMDLNPGYQHTLLTDEVIKGYVKEHFHTRNPDIEETFLQAGELDFVLKLDLIKYTVLWAEGGVYSDLDVACVKGVGEWVPERFRDETEIVVGVQKGEGGGDAGEGFGLADWTVMAKANQPFFWFVYQRFRENIRRLAAEEGVTGKSRRPYNVSDVTGGNALTEAFLAYATSVTATKVTGKNFTGFSEPMLFGEILVLPVQAFGNLVHHYEAGSWKLEPWDKLPEQKEVAEEEKNAEAEKQNLEDIIISGADQNLEDDRKEGVSEEEVTTPAGNSTNPAEVSTESKVGQTIVNGTKEASKPPEEGNKGSPVDEKKPTSNKPPSVQYENAKAKEKPTTNDKPPSVQYENAKVAGNVTESKHNTNNSTSQQSTNENTGTEDATDEDPEIKAEKETKAKEEAEKLKVEAAAQALEQEKEDAAAKEAAEAKKILEAQKIEEEMKAAEAQKRKEEEEEEEEEQKKKAAEPKWAPLNEAGVLASSNNLADYGAEFVPDE